MNKKLSFLTSVIIGIVVGVVGVIIWYTTYVTSEYDKRDGRIAELEEDVENLVKNQTTLTTLPDSSGTDPVSGLPVFVLEPAGLFSPEQKASLQDRLINPLFDYYNEDDLYAVTMNIRDEDMDSWIVTVINADGSSQGFLYGESSQAVQPWWTPECLGVCEFTNAFRGAYPEIVNLSLGL